MTIKLINPQSRLPSSNPAHLQQQVTKRLWAGLLPVDEGDGVSNRERWMAADPPRNPALLWSPIVMATYEDALLKQFDGWEPLKNGEVVSEGCILLAVRGGYCLEAQYTVPHNRPALDKFNNIYNRALPCSAIPQLKHLWLDYAIDGGWMTVGSRGTNALLAFQFGFLLTMFCL